MIGDFLEIGDKLIVNIPQENWSLGYRPFKNQNGTVVEIVGFSEIYNGYSNGSQKPGVYENKAWINVKEEGSSKTYCISSCFVEPVNKDEYTKRIEEHQNKTGRCYKTCEDKEKLRDLPITKAIDGDIVKVNFSKEDKFIILNVNYELSDKISYGVFKFGENNSGYTYIKEDEIESVERGNIWKYYFGGEDDKLIFSDIIEEAEFAMKIGTCHEMRNVNGSGNYSWQKDEVLDAIERGDVDCMGISSSFIVVCQFNTDMIYLSLTQIKDLC